MKKTQYGWIFFIVVILLGIIAAFNKSPKDLIIISVVGFVILLLFYKLTITVTEKEVSFSLGIGIIHGKYEISNVISCRPLTYVPFGWGVRLRPGVILFNVASNKAIELEIKNKTRKIWIGSNCPEEISEYIKSKM